MIYTPTRLGIKVMDDDDYHVFLEVDQEALKPLSQAYSLVEDVASFSEALHISQEPGNPTAVQLQEVLNLADHIEHQLNELRRRTGAIIRIVQEG